MKILFFWIIAEALSQLRHAHAGSRRAQAGRRAGQAQAAPGSLRQPSGRLRYPLAGHQVQRPVRLQAQAAGAAQCSSGSKRIRRAQTCSGALRRRRHAQEGTDTLRGTPGTLKHAQAGAGRLRSTLRHAQRRLRHGQVQASSDTLRHAQTRSETLRQAQIISRVIRHAPWLKHARSGRLRTAPPPNTLRLSRHAQEGSNSRLRHPQAQAGGQAGSSGQSGRLE
jgi:hypothetical protein